jgi:hypothetical protein
MIYLSMILDTANLIGGFDIGTSSFFWRYIIESKGKGNRFIIARFQ